MKLQLVILLSVALLASAVRERVLYEAFSGLDCQAADLGSITVRFEDSTEPRYDCTNYATTSYRSTANAPLPDPQPDWAYVAVQLSGCPITDAMEYALYAGKPATSCWVYSNFQVYVDGPNKMVSINLNETKCKYVDFLEDYNESPVGFCREQTGFSTGSAYGKYPITFAPVAAPVDAPVAQQTPNAAGSPQSSNTPVKSNTPSKTNNGFRTSAGFVALISVLSLCL